MSVEARSLPMPEPASESPASLAALDLFASAARPRRRATGSSGGGGRSFARGSFWRAAVGGDRATPPSRSSTRRTWPPSAVCRPSRAAGIDLLVAPADSSQARAAAEAGLRILLRVPYRLGEDDGERLDRLAAIDQAPYDVWGVMPAPVGESYGLDTLRLFALCRLALPRVPHLLADVGALGPRLAQMALGFGADELFAPIVAERALRLGANAHNPALTRKEAATLIRGAGLAPCERFGDGTIEEVSL